MRHLADVSPVGLASASVKHPQDAVASVKYSRTGIARGGERTIRVPVGEDADFDGSLLDLILFVDARKQFHA